MRVKLTLEEFLNRASKAFQALDLRITFVRTDKSSQSALLILRFSPESPSLLEARQQDLRRIWSRFLNMKRLNFVLKTLPYNDVDSLLKKLGQGQYHSHVDTISTGEEVDLLRLQSDFPGYSSWIRGESSWPCFVANTGKHLTLLYEDLGITQEIWLCGLTAEADREEPYILIGQLLEVDDYRSGTGFSFLLTAPFLARIKRDAPFDGRRYPLHVEFHECFNNEMQLNVYLENREGRPRIKEVFGPFPISSEERADGNPWLREWVSQIELASLEDHDVLRLHLIHLKPTPLIVDEFAGRGNHLLSLGRKAKLLADPLMAAVYRFVPTGELDNYLNWEEGKQPQDKFEQKVSKILSACGFSVIRLGHTRYEKLKDKNDPRVDRGSVDLLAYSDNMHRLLLVGCTIAPPGDRDIGELANAREILREEVFKEFQIHLMSVFFTEAKTLEDKSKQGVRLLDAEDIQYLVRGLSQREDREQLYSFIFSAPQTPPALEI